MEAEIQMKVDHNALKTNQAVIILLLAIGFLINQPSFVLFTGLAMLAGTILAIPAFKSVYQFIILPLGIAKPNQITDDPNSHRFAQFVGSLFLLTGSWALYTANLTMGWILAGVVIALAAVNLFAGFCLGCFMYYQISKLGLFGKASG